MDKEWDYQMFRSAWFNLNLANFCWTSASRPGAVSSMEGMKVPNMVLRPTTP